VLPVWIACAAVVALGMRPQLPPVCAASAQLLLPPLPLDPLDLPQPARGSTAVWAYQLPGDARAEVYEASGWLTVAGRHAVAGGVDYVGVDTSERAEWGGGPPWVQWSGHLGEPATSRGAFDLRVVLPLGDRSLYPVSTGAPSVTARLRASPLSGRRWRVWAGAWARRVSPPDDRTRPADDFPSGWGVEAAAHGAAQRLLWDATARSDLGGLPRTAWLQASAATPLMGEVLLRVGAATAIGPRADRPIDLGWTIGLVWRPPAAAPAGLAPPTRAP
jgi:hypothetical protein